MAAPGSPTTPALLLTCQRGVRLGLAAKWPLLVAVGALWWAQAGGTGEAASTRPALARDVPLFFFIGLQGPGAPELAKLMGLNAILYRLPRDAPARLQEVQAELAQVQAAGLNLILQLPTNLDLQQQLSLTAGSYWSELERYVATVVPALRATPGLVAWQTDDFLERALRYADSELSLFLQRRYGSVEALNAAWGTSFSRWEYVTVASAKAAAQNQPWGIGVPSVDLADWMAESFRTIMQAWARLVRRYDSEHLLMTGRLSLYRSLACVPPEYDVVVPAMRPDVLENDPLTGNVHAVDMARRGGRFAVIPALYLPLPPSPLFYQGRLTSWALEAAAHGARGIALEDWTRFTTLPRAGEGKPRPLDPERVLERARLLGQQLAPLTAAAGAWRVECRPSFAFLWTPYAGGLEAFKVPAYGYLESWSTEEPSRLFFAFRRGCAWGPPDYLTPADVPVVSLEQYGAILAPHALSLPQPAAQALEDWVASGGLLVADVGLGMYQSGDWHRLPAPLDAVMGLAQLVGGAEQTTNWQVARVHRLLPELPPGQVALGLVDPRLWRGPAPATARQPWAVQGWMAFAHESLDAPAVAIASTQPTPDKKGRLVAGIFAHAHGLGGGVFATFRLWGRWNPGDPLFATFHEMLCGRRGTYRLGGGFWPEDFVVVPARGGAYLLALAAGLAELTAYQAQDQLHSGAYCLTSAEWRRPDGRRAGDVQMLVEAPALALVPLRRLPVAVRPYERSCWAHVDLYGPKALQLTIYGDRPVLRRSNRGLSLTRGLPVPVRVIISDGEYAVRPGSVHRVTIVEAGRAPQQTQVTADAAGQLAFDLTVASAHVLVEPAPGGSAALGAS
jgi:hypothetical protein